MGLWLCLLIFFGSFLTELKPDFDFEKFFPLDDPDLIFYQKHLEVFDYDNDYITFIAETDSTVFEIAFLSRLDSLSELLKKITNIESVTSPTQLRELVDTPIGAMTISALNYKNQISLEKSSQRFINHPLFKSFVSQDQKSIILQSKHSHLALIEDSEDLLGAIDLAIAQSLLKDVRIVGRLPAQRAFTQLIQDDFILFLILALSLSFVLLKYLFITWRAALIPFLVAISTLICTLGLMALTETPLSIIAALIPPIILFTSTSDCVHLMNAYHQIGSKKGDQSITKAVRKVFLPTFLTSVTTAIGFLSLITMPISPIREFGVFSAIGVVFAFLFTFTITPLFIKGIGNVRILINVHWIGKYILPFKKSVFAVVFLLLTASVIGILNLKTDARLLSDLPKENTIRQDFDFLDTHYGGSKPWELAITIKGGKTLWDYEVSKQVDLISSFIEDSLEVNRIWSPTSMLRYGNQVVNNGDYAQFKFPDSLGFSRAKSLILKIYSSVPQPNVIGRNNEYARLIGFIPQVGSGKTQEMNISLEKFIKNHIDNGLIEAKITGTTALIDKSHHLISEAMMKGLFFAVLLVSIILGVYFKSFKLALISLIPNLLPLIITAGIMGLFGITLNLTTSIIFAIAFGIAVDDTIHFIVSYQTSTENKELKVLKTLQTTGNGMALTTLIVLAGFSVFLFSSFGATYYLGLFLVIALSFALIIDLTLLPILLDKIKLKQPD